MSDKEQQECERIQKIMKQQIASRYAGSSNQLRFNVGQRVKKAPSKTRLTFRQWIGRIENRYKGAGIGLLLGLAMLLYIAFVLPHNVLWLSVSGVALVLPMVIGWILGGMVQS